MPKPRKPKRRSRQERLGRVEEEFRALAEEYQAWRDAMPGNLATSELAGRLEEVVEQLTAWADDVAALDLPLGFGR
jgi:hypothetical protein